MIELIIYMFYLIKNPQNTPQINSIEINNKHFG